MKALLSLFLFLMALLCGYGLLASFEFPGVTGWKIGYALAGGLFLILAFLAARGGGSSSE